MTFLLLGRNIHMFIEQGVVFFTLFLKLLLLFLQELLEKRFDGINHSKIIGSVTLYLELNKSEERQQNLKSVKMRGAVVAVGNKKR